MNLVSLQFAGGLAVEGQGLRADLLYCQQPSAFFSIPVELKVGVPCVPLFVSLFLVGSYKIHLSFD